MTIDTISDTRNKPHIFREVNHRDKIRIWGDSVVYVSKKLWDNHYIWHLVHKANGSLS